MRGIWDLWARRNIARLIDHRRPAIVQTWMGRATRLTHLPAQGQTVHLARLGGYYNPKGYRHAHAWVGNTRGICDYLIREGLPANRVFHIGNFYELEEPEPTSSDHSLRDSLDISAEDIVVLTTGRLHVNKGFPDLLEAVAELPEETHGRRLVFLIVGDGPQMQALRAQAGQLGITHRLKWTGWQDDPARYYRLADLFVCPSRHEPLGNVILEAWHHGVPIVSTRSQGPAELITHEEDGILVPCRDPQALARAVFWLLDQPPDTQRQLTENGRRTLSTRFSRSAITTAYTELYAKLVRAR